MLRFGPLLLFGIPAGVLTDRLERRKLLFFTQSAYVLTAGALAVATFTGTPDLLLIYALVLARGFLNAIDNPLRRGFIRDLVTDDELTNAVSFNSTINTLARFVGPGLAGLVIVGGGVQWCFALNAVSYGAVLISLFRIDARSTRPRVAQGTGMAQVVEGLRYVWEDRRIRRTLIMVAVVGLFAHSWDVALPLYATNDFGGSASLYGLFASTIGVGAFAVTWFVMRMTRIGGSDLRTACIAMAVALVALALAPFPVAAIAGLLLLGAASTSFQIFAQSRLQLAAEDRISGRVLAIYSVALVGTRPVGAVVAGAIADAAGPRAVFAFSAAVVAVLVGALYATRPTRIAAPKTVVPIDDAPA